VSSALGRIWTAAGALAAGVVVGQSFAWAAGAALAVVGGFLLVLRRRPLLAVAGLSLVAAGAGIVSSSARSSQNSVLTVLAERVPSCRVTGRVLEQLGGLGTLIALDRVRCEGFEELERPGVVVADVPAADSGADVSGAGWIVPLRDDPFDTQRRRLGAHARLDAVKLDVGRVRSPVAAVAARVRNGLRAATSELDAGTGGLLRGLAIGDVTGIDPTTEETLRRAGLSHLVAVSGSNVAIVLGTIALVCRRLGLRLRVSLACAALLIFVAVVGPEPSVLRAAFMGGIGLAAIAAGHRAEPLHALGIAVIVVLSLRPGMVSSIGLHLSAAATAGIVLWTGPLSRKMSWLPTSVAAPLSATLAAQLAVAPLLVLGFGEVSVAAPLANLVVLPAVPVGTILGLISGAIGALVPDAGAAVARIAAPAGVWILEVGDAFGGQWWASATVPRWVGVLMAGAVVIATASLLRSRLNPQPQ
jgi:competence protein ComEC